MTDPAGRLFDAPRRLGRADLAMGGLFALAGALQFNDPDPLAWAAIYFAAAGACWLAASARRRPSALRPARVALALVAVVALAWAVALAPTALPDLAPRHLFEGMQAETPAIETSREWLGLLLILGWAIVAWIRLPADGAPSR